MIQLGHLFPKALSFTLVMSYLLQKYTNVKPLLYQQNGFSK